MNVVTEGSTPFRLSLNYGDVGHTLIIGPTGAGKSTLLRALESAWLRYPNAQVYTFDKNKSSLILTKAVGGEFYDLGSDESGLAFQPLADVDQAAEASWALEWITTARRARRRESRRPSGRPPSGRLFSRSPNPPGISARSRGFEPSSTTNP